jgi:hypothetical protein
VAARDDFSARFSAAFGKPAVDPFDRAFGRPTEPAVPEEETLAGRLKSGHTGIAPIGGLPDLDAAPRAPGPSKIERTQARIDRQDYERGITRAAERRDQIAFEAGQHSGGGAGGGGGRGAGLTDYQGDEVSAATDPQAFRQPTDKDLGIFGEGDTLRERARKFLVRNGASFRQWAGGALQQAAESDAFAYDPTKPFTDSERADMAREHNEEMDARRKIGTVPGQQLYEAAQRDLDANQYAFHSKGDEYGQQIADSLVQMIPTVAAAIATRGETAIPEAEAAATRAANPVLRFLQKWGSELKDQAPGLGILAHQQGATQYGESRAAGRSVAMSDMDATVFGLAEALPEALPLGSIMKPGQKFLPHLLKSAGFEGASEVLTQAIEDGYSAGVIGQDMTWGQARQNMIDAGIIGFGMGFGMGGSVHLFDKVRRPSAPGHIEQAAEESQATPEDQASPLAGVVDIGAAKTLMAGATAKVQADSVLDRNAAPRTGQMVELGGKRWTVDDAFTEDGEDGLTISRNGQRQKVFFKDLADAGMALKPIADPRGAPLDQAVEQATGQALPAPAAPGTGEARAAAAPISGREQLKAHIRRTESSGNDNAQNTRSSASGRYQFTDSTFNAYYRKVYGSEPTAAVRNDPEVQERLMDALTKDNEAALKKAGITPTAGHLYLAHFAGVQGAINLLRNPQGSAATILGTKAAQANPTVIPGKTSAELVAWADGKMNSPSSPTALGTARFRDGTAAEPEHDDGFDFINQRLLPQSEGATIQPAAETPLPSLEVPAPTASLDDGKGDGSREAPRQIENAADLDIVAPRVNTEPTEAQAEASNYRHAHVNLHGLDIAIENPAGSTRRGTDPDGKPWETVIPAAYGRIKRTTGADGDHVDVYIGPHPASEQAFVIDQYDPKTRKFDETKTVLGVDSAEEATAIYDAGFSDGSGPERRGAITPMSVAEFKTFAEEEGHKPASGALEMPAAEQMAPAKEAAAPANEDVTTPAEQSGPSVAPEDRAELEKDGAKPVLDASGQETGWWASRREDGDTDLWQPRAGGLSQRIVGQPDHARLAEIAAKVEAERPAASQPSATPAFDKSPERALADLTDDQLAAVAKAMKVKWTPENRNGVVERIAQNPAADVRAAYTAATAPKVSEESGQLPTTQPSADTGQFDPGPHVEKLRSYIATSKSSLNDIGVIAKHLGVAESEAHAVMGAVASRPNAGFRMTKGRAAVYRTIQTGGGRRKGTKRVLVNKAVPPRYQRESGGEKTPIQFIRSLGGIRSGTHDLRNVGALARHPGLISTKGRPVDEIGGALHEAGYFPNRDPSDPDQRPTEAETLEYLARISQPGAAKTEAESETDARGRADGEITAAIKASDGLLPDAITKADREAIIDAMLATGDDAANAVMAHFEHAFASTVNAGAAEVTDDPDYDIPFETGAPDVEAETVRDRESVSASAAEDGDRPAAEPGAAGEGEAAGADSGEDGRQAVGTAPEHATVGVDERELSEIVQEFDAAAATENGVTNVFAPPAKGEIVRLNDKAKVYHREHGWMTPAEARAKIEEWKAHAAAQGETRANADKVVLSLFDLTGKWSEPWESAGYNVFRFDIQADPEMGDVNSFSTDFFGDWFGDFEGQDIYAILAACPCTDFASSGARHFAAKDKDGRTVASVRLVQQTLATIEYFKPAVWAIENPVGRIEKLGGLPPWRLSFDPNALGETYTKKTLLWGRFNADLPIAPVDPVEGSKMHSQYGGKSMATKNARSATPEGFAYGFFMANNAVDQPAMAIANKYDRLDRGLIERAVKAGVTEGQIKDAVDDFYYMDIDDDAANEAVKALIPTSPAGKGPATDLLGEPIAEKPAAPAKAAPDTQDDMFGTREGDERRALEKKGEGRLKSGAAQKAAGADGGIFDSRDTQTDIENDTPIGQARAALKQAMDALDSVESGAQQMVYGADATADSRNVERAGADAGIRELDANEGALPQSQKPSLPEVRRSGDQGMPGVGGELRAVPGRPRASSDADTLARPDRRGEGVRAGQRPVGDAGHAGAEPTNFRSRPDASGANDDARGVGEKDGGAARNDSGASREGREPAGGSVADEAGGREGAKASDISGPDAIGVGVGEGNRDRQGVVEGKAEAGLDGGEGAYSTEGSLRTTSPEFLSWFNGSKVVDENGKPLVMYHGTSRTQAGEAFDTFDTYASNYGLMGMGGYFTADPEIASRYTKKGGGGAATVYPVYLSIQKPLDMEAPADPAAWEKAFPGAGDFHEGGDTNEAWYRAAEEVMIDEGLPRWEGAEAMQDGLRGMGYDGITHLGGGGVNQDGPRHRVYVAFDPTQIKSLFNRGTFDAEDGRMAFSVSDRNNETATSGKQFGKRTYFHGSPSEIDGPLRPSSSGVYGPGVYLSKKERSARDYGERLIRGAGRPVFVSRHVIRGKLATALQFSEAMAESLSTGLRGSELKAAAQKVLRERGFSGLQDSDVTVIFDAADVIPAGSMDHGNRRGDPADPKDFDTLLREWKPKLEGALKRLGIADRVLLNLVDRMVEGETVHGSYWRRVISVALGVSTDPAYTVNHEAIHALRALGVFRPAEWTALTKAVREDPRVLDGIRSRYGHLQLTEAQYEEEAIADLYGHWSAARAKVTGFIAKAFQRIKDLFNTINAALSGDVQAGQVFRDIERGKIGRRESGSGASFKEPAKPQFDQADDRILFSLADEPKAAGASMSGILSKTQDATGALKAPTKFDRIGEAVDDIRIALQDRMLPGLRAEQAAEKVLGRPLTDEERPYLQEELMTGRVGAALERLTDDLIEPLFETMKTEKITTEEIESYLYARHAPERNARIAEINPEFAEGGGSGMTDLEAAAIMARIKRDGRTEAFERVAARVDALRDFGVAYRVETGLMSQKQADEWKALYDHYVPLRGFAEGDDDSRPADSRGISVRGPESKRAFGRRSQAADLLAHTVMQAEESVVRGQKNLVGQAFYNLAKQAKDDDFWKLHKVRIEKTINKETGLVERKLVTELSPGEEQYTVFLKVNGEPKRVTMEAKNPAARKLAAAMRRLDETQMNMLLSVFSRLNRYLSAVNTSLSPEFVITNAFRDIQEATANLSGFDLKGLQAGTLKDYPAAMKAAVKGSFKKESGEWGKWWREFTDAGGRVFYNQVRDIPELRRDIDKKLRRLTVGSSGKLTPGDMAVLAKGGIHAVFHYIEAVNLGVENAVRLSAYKNARERGMSINEAASLAKGLTVNFNRRGTWGAAANAMYLFYNASIQGSARVLVAMKHKRVRRIVYGMILSGLLLDLLNRAISGDDDDGESFYDKISDFDKSRNLIIMDPGGSSNYVKLPLPWGYSTFFSVGRIFSEAAHGRSLSSAMGSLATAFVDAFNPIGGDNSIANFIAPTILDPVVDLERNRDFANRPIMPDQPQFGPPLPDNQRYWNSVRPQWKAVTDFLNTHTGGDKVVPGAVDVSPETLQYLFGTGTGAAGAFYDRMASLGGKAWGVINGDPDVELDRNDIPLYRKVVGSKPGHYDKAAFYARLEQIEGVKHEAKQYLDAKEFEGLDRLKARQPDVIAAIPAAKQARKEMKKLNATRRLLDSEHELGRVDAATYKAKAAEIKAAQDKVIAAFNRYVLSHVKDPATPEG